MTTRPILFSAPTVGSICAGIGGFDLAFERAGFVTKWYCEVEKNCLKLLADKFPNATNHGDLNTFKPTGSDAVDVICGGTPCQDLSVAGQRTGLDGKRSGLFWQMVRVCKRLQPRVIVWENVPGAFSSQSGRDFASVLRAFTGLAVGVPAEGWGNAGFMRTPFPLCRWNVVWRILDAQYFGLAQRRERLFLVASFGDASCLEILFEPQSVCGDPPSSREKGQTTSGVIAGCSNGGGANGPGRTADDADSLVIAGTLGSPNGGGDSGQRTSTEREHLSRQLPCASTGGGQHRIDGESETFVTHTLKAEGHDASEDGSGSGVPVIPTCTSVRRLTPVECEKLQGFPTGYTAILGSDSAKYRAIGNAVAVPVVEWIAKRVAAHLNPKPAP